MIRTKICCFLSYFVLVLLRVFVLQFLHIYTFVLIHDVHARPFTIWRIEFALSLRSTVLFVLVVHHFSLIFCSQVLYKPFYWSGGENSYRRYRWVPTLAVRLNLLGFLKKYISFQGLPILYF